ncbi:MAG: SDR family NAD(P)-dependent oxidoreductase [Actinomycetota bacterium]
MSDHGLDLRLLVAGASSGVGAAVATEAIDRGARVAGIARRADLLARIEGLVAAPADVCHRAALGNAVDDALDALDGLDAVVIAAGINRPGLIADTTPDDWRAVLDTNVVGLLNVAQATMSALRSGRSPTLVVISSNAARQVVSAQNAIYSASKAAVAMLADALRLEFAGDVRVVEIAPAYIRDTEIHRDYLDPAHRAEADERQQTYGMELGHFARLVVDVLAQPDDVEVRSLDVSKPGYVLRPYRS